MFDTIKNQESWEIYKAGLSKRYNMDAIVKDDPASYPCLVKTFPKSDCNGWQIKTVFVYLADLKQLENAANELVQERARELGMNCIPFEREYPCEFNTPNCECQYKS